MKTLCSPIALLRKYTLRSAMPAIAAVLMISSFSVQALAQDSDPEWKVVTTETEAVRCGDQDIYYTITEVQRGAIFAVDGTSGDYSKVRYPADLGAVVRADEVRVIKAGTQVQLTKESMLKAESMLRGLAGSWNTVYTTPLPADTVLSVLDVIYEETTDGSRGEVLGYRVAPPRPPVAGSHPYAYVRTSSLRDATPEEIKTHQGGKQITTGRPQLMPAPNRNERNTDAENSSTEGSGQSELETENADSTATDETESVESTGDEEVIDLRDDMVLPDPTDVTNNESGSEESSAESPIEIQNTPPVTKPDTRIIPEKSGNQSTTKSSATISISSLEALEASFINARSMPREQLDEALPELLAEFTRAREAVGDDESDARPLDQRIEWLNIRLKTRDQRRAIAAALASADEQSVELNRKMDQWNNSRVYALVGRLMLSGVYTGEHLPLLYRVRAPDPVTGFDRTIGYIAPRDGQDLRPYLGRVIGVIGDPVRDEQLALTVISPTKIDQMPGQ